MLKQVQHDGFGQGRAGIQSGKQLRQRGAGMPSMNGRGHGDMVLQVEVETPTKLNARQREILEQFRDTETGKECSNFKGFFVEIEAVLRAEQVHYETIPSASFASDVLDSINFVRSVGCGESGSSADRRKA